MGKADELQIGAEAQDLITVQLTMLYLSQKQSEIHICVYQIFFLKD